ncbi:hypothetical protein [Burkholderia multivorans]|uniref:hypothetical protein n=1 Tax=Burkholderia multivorans TaxID=87883 RepID=UPI0011B240F5|nr:hypothetical protein [Burkholderia multivorans]
MQTIGFVSLIGFAIFLSSFLGKDGAVIVIFLIGISFSIGWVFLILKSGKQKREAINKKYSDPVAKRVLAGDCWIGQNRSQLRDSLGLPEKIEIQENSRSRKEVWKFFYKNSRRIRLKIILTDGVVTQIDRK